MTFLVPEWNRAGAGGTDAELESCVLSVRGSECHAGEDQDESESGGVRVWVGRMEVEPVSEQAGQSVKMCARDL